ncbi:MAG TPA: glycosyltransferase family 39 protein [Pirellulales bacterium]|nr:glycosyltransferase family 39 protein [Pirellulales bacterium]
MESSPRLLTKDGLPIVAHTADQYATLAQRAAWLLVGVGMVLRLMRYLMQFPLWGDECHLADNFLTRDFLGLLRPLDHCQVAPIGYLWIELATVKLFGFSELTLRLPSIVSSLAALLLFRRVAFRALSPLAALLAVAFFAMSYYQVRHAAEVKPYASDVLMSTILVALAVEYWRQPGATRWLWYLAAVAPLAVLISLPSVFVAGAVGLGVAMIVWRNRSRSAWAALAVYAATLGASFAVVCAVSVSSQDAAWGERMRDFWATSFPPPITQPLRFIKFLATAHTGRMFAYPIGGERGASTATFLLSLIAFAVLCRRRAWPMLATCLGMFVLAFTAAVLHRYPYADTERMVQYMGPVICLLAGLGAATVIGAIAWAQWRRRLLQAALIFFVAVALGTAVRDLLHPYKGWDDWAHIGFARWFWTQAGGTGDMVCVKSELGYEPWQFTEPWSYFCYQRLCSPRHRTRQPPRGVEALAADRPVRCVEFGVDIAPRNDEQHQAWMRAMTARFDLTSQAQYKVHLGREQGREVYGVYDLYQFMPKLPQSTAANSVIQR